MTLSYLDASAAMKLVVDEPESAALAEMVTYEAELGGAARAAGLAVFAPDS